MKAQHNSSFIILRPETPEDRAFMEADYALENPYGDTFTLSARDLDEFEIRARQSNLRVQRLWARNPWEDKRS